MKGKINVEVRIDKDSVTQEQIADLLSTALSGSSWCGVDNDTPAYKEAQAKFTDLGWKDICLEIVLADLLIDEQDILLYDIEDEDETFGLDLPLLLSGVEQFLETNPQYIYDMYDQNTRELDLSNLDGADADEILQYALFNEIVYS